MKVLKFGGTSTGSAQRMQDIYNIVRNQRKCMVILSAMSGTTNALLEISKLVRDNNRQKAREKAEKLKIQYEGTAAKIFGVYPPVFNYINQIFQGIEKSISLTPGQQTDYVIVATGEMLSTYMFHQLLLSNNIATALLDATRLIQLNQHGEPEITDIGKRLKNQLKLFPDAQIYVTQGFICSNFNGEISNLGRGGSDYSASLFGAAINTEEIQIWTDIDGVQNNDPRYIEHTYPIRRLMFDEAAELAYFGAKILHPACVLPAQKADIPVFLKNTLHPDDPGTKISKNIEGKGFKAVAARDHITAIKIKSSRMLLAYGFLRKVFEVFESYKTPIDMITTSEVAVSITIDDINHLPEIIEALQLFGNVIVEKNKTIVGIVGSLVADETGYAHALFKALKDIPIRMISYGASPHNISILINSEDKVRTLQALNSNLFQ